MEATHKIDPREFLSKDTCGSSGSPVSVHRRDTVSRRAPRPSSPVSLTLISLGFTGFKLVLCIPLYNSLSLSVYLALPTIPALESLSRPSPSLYLRTPRQSSALSITPHRRNKRETHRPASTYTWLLMRTRVSGTCLSILEEGNRNSSNQPANQTRKNSIKKECILSFYILVYKPSTFSEMISFFKKKKSGGK